jgi:hypothetical protein
VTSIVQFGNFQARYFAEQVQQYMETVEAVHSRLAEATLLAAIHAGSTQATASNYEIGAARDFLAEIDRAASAYRYRNRMGLAPDAPLRLIYPAFVNDMIRADLARNVPGDSGGQSERLAIADAEIEDWFRVRGINASTTLDSLTGGNAYSGGQPLQGFGAQGNGAVESLAAEDRMPPLPRGRLGLLGRRGAQPRDGPGLHPSTKQTTFRCSVRPSKKRSSGVTRVSN